MSGSTGGSKTRKTKIRHLLLLTVSIAIGTAAAFGAILFRMLIEIFQNLFWPSGFTFVERVMGAPAWLIIAVPASAGLVAGMVITRVAPEIRGPGVSELIAAVAGKASIIRHRVTSLKVLVTSLLIGSGASLGREGPVALIGASAGSSIAQILNFQPDMRRVCLASGAAAGIAATFNAPIAGTLFAVEIILLDIQITHISYIVIASVVASVISRTFWGDFPVFSAPDFYLFHHWELLVYLLLGVVSGLISILFVRLIYGTDSLFRSIPIPEWTKPGIGGLLMGIIGLRLPQVMGIGYEAVNMSLAGILEPVAALVLLGGKLFATALCIGSGMSGGVFAPSLVIGAATGSFVGSAVGYLFPGATIIAGNYALAGMGAVVAGTTLAPITAILTIFELTYSNRIILPVMVSCITSSMLVRLFFGYSVYEMQLLRKGVNIIRGHDAGILKHLFVNEVMTSDFEYLYTDDQLPVIVDRTAGSLYPHFVVLSRDRRLAGIISLKDLKGGMDRFEDLREVVIAADIMTSDVITIRPTDDLETALNLFENHRISFMPVTDALNPSFVTGILKKDDLLRAYRERVLKTQMLSDRKK